MKLAVVFTGQSKRFPARLESITDDPDDDLALLQIKPFDDMPVIEHFDPATPTPAPGSEVFLFGFPLGKLALQEGDRVIASTFKGILSRQVGKFLQIDAGVHPGNSGGPVTYSHGRVVGIVSRVQVSPDRTVASSIGYVIPVSTAQKVWPPSGSDGN